MINIAPHKIMERVAFHLNLRYWRQILVERTKVTKTMILLPRTLMLIKKRLQIPRMCGCQLDNLRSIILPNLMCWIAPKDDGKVSARCDQFLMATLTNHLFKEISDFPSARILDAHSVCQSSNLPMSANDSHLQIALLMQWSHELLLSWWSWGQ